MQFTGHQNIIQQWIIGQFYLAINTGCSTIICHRCGKHYNVAHNSVRVYDGVEMEYVEEVKEETILVSQGKLF